MKLRLLIFGLLLNTSFLFAQETPSYANFVIRSSNFVIQHWSEFKYYTAQQRQMDDEIIVFEIKTSFSTGSIKKYFNDHFLKVKGFIPKISIFDSIVELRPEPNFPIIEFNTILQNGVSEPEVKKYQVELYLSPIYIYMGKYYTKISIEYPGPRSVAKLYLRFDSSLNIEEYVIHGIIE